MIMSLIRDTFNALCTLLTPEPHRRAEEYLSESKDVHDLEYRQRMLMKQGLL